MAPEMRLLVAKAQLVAAVLAPPGLVEMPPPPQQALVPLWVAEMAARAARPKEQVMLEVPVVVGAPLASGI